MKSKLATTAAVLREAITVPVQVNRPDRRKHLDGKPRFTVATERKKLSAEAVAGWLGVTNHNVASIETGRVHLTPENAEALSYETGASMGWLLAGDPRAPIRNTRGRPYTQADFDRRQREIAQGNVPRSICDNDLRAVRRALADNVARVAGILLRAFELGQFEACDYRLGKALRSFDKGEPGSFTRFALLAHQGNPTTTRPDLGPLLTAWDTRLREAASKSPPPTKPEALTKAQLALLTATAQREAAKPRPEIDHTERVLALGLERFKKPIRRLWVRANSRRALAYLRKHGFHPGRRNQFGQVEMTLPKPAKRRG